MAAKCPHKSHPDYKLMVKLFGEENALYLYDSNDQEIPSFELISTVYKQNFKKDIPDAILQEYLKDVNSGSLDKRKESIIEIEAPTVRAGNIRDSIFEGKSNAELLRSRFDTSELLESLMKAGFVPEYLKDLPNLLKIGTTFKFVEKFDNPNTYMNYNTLTGVVTFSVQNLTEFPKRSETFARSLLHEVIHLYTARALDSPANEQEEAFKKEMERLYEAAIKKAIDGSAIETDLNKLIKSYYGFTNVLEFTSEIMTNSRFRKFVFNNNPSLFERFINALVRLFTGANVKSEKGSDILAESMQAILEQIETVNAVHDKENREFNIVFLGDQIKYYEGELSRMDEEAAIDPAEEDAEYRKSIKKTLDRLYKERENLRVDLDSRVPGVGSLWTSLREGGRITEDNKYYINRDGNREVLTDTHNPDVWEIKNKEGLVENKYVKGDVYPLNKKKTKFLIKTVGKKLTYLRNKYTGATFSTANVAQAYTHINVSVPLSGRVLEQRNIPFPNSITQKTYYHGSNNPNITSFSLEYEGTSNAGNGINFTEDIEYAKEYGNYIYEVKLNVSKWVQKDSEAKIGNTYAINDVDEVVVYHPEQIYIITSNKLEKLSRYELKKQKLLKAFPRVQEIIEDETIPVLGQIEASGTVIRVNPTLMKEDTIGHEFGHLLLVLLGGMNNPLVQRAYRHLEGTQLAEQVRREYADQSEMTIQLEILAQAIGEESIDFENIQDEIAREEAKNMWQKMLMKLFERLKALLHIDKGAVRELTKLLYTGVEDTGISFDEVYEQRKSRDGKENTEKPLGGRSLELPDYINKLDERTTNIEQLLIKAKDVLHNKRAIYERHNNVVALNSIDSTLKAMEEGTDTITSLMRFVSTAAVQIDSVYDKYYIDAKNAFKNGDKGAVSVKDLNRWLNYVIAFDSLEPIRLAVIETVGREKFAEMSELRGLLDNTITKKNDIKSFYIEAGKTLIADRLAELSTRVESTFKLLFERRWKTLSKEEKGDLTMEEYISNNVAISKEDIGNRTNKLMLDQLDTASFDISYIARLADNLLDSDDTVVATLVKMVVEALDKARIEGLEYRDQMVDMVRELEKVQKNSLLTNPEDFYAFAIETDEKGNKKNHLIHKMRSSFFEDYRAYSELLETEEGQDMIDERRSWLNRWQRSFTTDEVKKLMRTEWKEANAPLDRDAFKKAKWAMLSEMLDANKITPEEFEILKTDEQYKEFKDIFLLLDNNEGAASEISNWVYENVWLFRSPIDKYRNPQWEKLQKMRAAGIKNGVQTDARIKFYDFILTSNAKADKWLPRSFRLYTKLPAVAKDTVERLKTGKNIGASLSETVKHTFKVRSYDTERGEMSGTETLELKDETGKPKMFLPVYYSGNISVEDQSFDLGTIYLDRYKMAVEYKNKHEILPEVELTKYLVENRDVIRTDSNNNPIKSVNKKLTNRELTKSGKNSLIAAQLEDWLKTVFYDKAAEDEGTITIPMFNVEVDKAKILDALNRYTSLNLLGLNVVQGTANIALGEVMQIAEAFAGEHYDMKNYHKASRYYSSRLWGIAADIGQRKPTNIISILLEQMNILNDYDDPTNLRKSTVFRQMITTDSLFFIAHSGEHLMQSRAMLAVMDATKARDKDGKVIKNDKGKELSLLDVIEAKDGKISTKHGAVFTTDQMLNMSNKIKRMLARMHGEYSKAGKVALQRYALGRMVYMFRKFIYMGHKRRWETGNRAGKEGDILYKYNELSESFTEGAYISFYRFSKKFLADVIKFKFKLAKTHYSDMDSIERANVHRTLTELSFAVTLLAASTLLLNLKGEEDDDDKKFFYNHLLYQTLRLRTELAFFINPIQAWTILKSPAASMSVVENLFRLLNILLNPFDEDWLNGKFETGPWKGHYKFEKYAINMTPAIKQYFRIRDVDTLIGQFK